MSRLPAAPMADALGAWMRYSAWWGGWMPIRCAAWPPEQLMWRQGPDGDLASLVRWMDERADEEIRLGLPQNQPNAGGVVQTSVLWARVEGSKQTMWARRFKPLPTMAIAEGTSSRRILIWALDRCVPWVQAKAANRRLAYKFGAVQKLGDPDEMWLPAPGTCLRQGRSRPVPVFCSRLTDAVFAPERFAASRWLKDPPEYRWWETG